MLTCWKPNVRPATPRVPRPSGGPDGKSGDARAALPIATLHVRGDVIVGVTAPAGVDTEKVSSLVQPSRRR